MKKLFYRAFQSVMRVAMYFVPYNKPQIYYGEQATLDMARDIAAAGHKKVLVVTDQGVMKLGLCNLVFSSLEENGVEFVIFDQTVANPTIENAEEGLEEYNQNHCTAIIAIGGGSAMDCAKAIGARATNPNKTIRQMRGILKVRHAQIGRAHV